MNCPIIRQNESVTDRVIRVIFGIILLAVGRYDMGGTVQIVSYVLGAILLVTGAVGYCALYQLFGISTNSKKK